LVALGDGRRKEKKGEKPGIQSITQFQEVQYQVQGTF
jgi:hypothetical protein